MVTKKQSKSFFIEFFIWVGITLLFIFTIFLLFLLIRILFRKNGMEWEHTIGTAYLLVYSGFTGKWDSSSLQSIFKLFSLFHGVFMSITIFVFVLKFYKNYLFWKDLKFFFKKLPRKNQILLCWFTFSCGIPNKIWVNNNARDITLVLSQFSIVYFCYLEPIFLLFLFDFLNIFFFSGFFAYMYENNFERSPFFQIQVKKYLFNGSDEFAKFYFDFFWGNMSSEFTNGAKMYTYGLGALYLNTKYEKYALKKVHLEIYNKDVSDFIAANEKGALTVDVMKTLKDKALSQALYHQSTPTLTSYNVINKKFSEMLDKLSSSGF